jgi:hypothetical protein
MWLRPKTTCQPFSTVNTDLPRHATTNSTRILRANHTTVLDLPALYTKPSAQALLSILSRFALPPPSWDRPTTDHTPAPAGFDKWLVSVIASPLSWLSEEEQETIRDTASERISERCGRSARGEMQRVFRIPVARSKPHLSASPVSSPGSSGANTPALQEEEDDKAVEITLNEPALTADNLGLKTWASSYLLSKRLATLELPVVSRALELGAGTGLVGLAAAATLGTEVLLTDLPEIVPNLKRNIETNRHLGVEVRAEVLDWRDMPDPLPKQEDTFELVMAADPLYSSEHPKLLVDMVKVWLKKSPQARAVVETPLRDGYQAERDDFRRRMLDGGLVIADEGTETGFDDWGEKGGEVRCWWSVWRWR